MCLQTQCKVDGSVERYKARLVAKGYAQEKGIDFEETFVLPYDHCLQHMFIGSSLWLEHTSVEYQTAFLNGDLHEEVYVLQPHEFIQKGQENRACSVW